MHMHGHMPNSLLEFTVRDDVVSGVGMGLQIARRVGVTWPERMNADAGSAG